MPGSTDRRKLVVQFNDGSGWQTVPAMDINANPFALQAVSAHKLGNYDASDYLRTATLPDCTGQALTYNGVTIGCGWSWRRISSLFIHFRSHRN